MIGAARFGCRRLRELTWSQSTDRAVCPETLMLDTSSTRPSIDSGGTPMNLDHQPLHAKLGLRQVPHTPHATAPRGPGRCLAAGRLHSAALQPRNPWGPRLLLQAFFYCSTLRLVTYSTLRRVSTVIPRARNECVCVHGMPGVKGVTYLCAVARRSSKQNMTRAPTSQT